MDFLTHLYNKDNFNLLNVVNTIKLSGNIKFINYGWSQKDLLLTFDFFGLKLYNELFVTMESLSTKFSLLDFKQKLC